MAASIQNWAAQAKVAHNAAVQTLVDFATEFRDRVAYRRALAGNNEDVLDVPDAMRRVYVQLGGAGGSVAEAEYDQYKPALGDGVFVMRARILQGGGWLILGQCFGTELPCFDDSAVV